MMENMEKKQPIATSSGTSNSTAEQQMANGCSFVSINNNNSNMQPLPIFTPTFSRQSLIESPLQSPLQFGQPQEQQLATDTSYTTPSPSRSTLSRSTPSGSAPSRSIPDCHFSHDMNDFGSCDSSTHLNTYSIVTGPPIREKSQSIANTCRINSNSNDYNYNDSQLFLTNNCNNLNVFTMNGFATFAAKVASDSRCQSQLRPLLQEFVTKLLDMGSSSNVGNINGTILNGVNSDSINSMNPDWGQSNCNHGFPSVEMQSTHTQVTPATPALPAPPATYIQPRARDRNGGNTSLSLVSSVGISIGSDGNYNTNCNGSTNNTSMSQERSIGTLPFCATSPKADIPNCSSDTGDATLTRCNLSMNNNNNNNNVNGCNNTNIYCEMGDQDYNYQSLQMSTPTLTTWTNEFQHDCSYSHVHGAEWNTNTNGNDNRTSTNCNGVGLNFGDFRQSESVPMRDINNINGNSNGCHDNNDSGNNMVLSNNGWHCQCGNINTNRTDICSCGRSRKGRKEKRDVSSCNNDDSHFKNRDKDDDDDDDQDDGFNQFSSSGYHNDGNSNLNCNYNGNYVYNTTTNNCNNCNHTNNYNQRQSHDSKNKTNENNVGNSCNKNNKGRHNGGKFNNSNDNGNNNNNNNNNHKNNNDNKNNNINNTCSDCGDFGDFGIKNIGSLVLDSSGHFYIDKFVRMSSDSNCNSNLTKKGRDNNDVSKGNTGNKVNADNVGFQSDEKTESMSSLSLQTQVACERKTDCGQSKSSNDSVNHSENDLRYKVVASRYNGNRLDDILSHGSGSISESTRFQKFHQRRRRHQTCYHSRNGIN